MTDLIGFVAAICTTIAFAPQLLQAWRTQSTTDISLGMFLLLTFGILFWLIYGALKGDAPLIAANAVTLALAGGILFLKIKHVMAPPPAN